MLSAQSERSGLNPMLVIPDEMKVPFEVPTRAERRLRGAQRRLHRAMVKKIKARQLTVGARGSNAVNHYQGNAELADVKVTYRGLQVIGKSRMAKKLAKHHKLHGALLTHSPEFLQL